MLKLTPKDKDVVDAFTEQKPATSKKLSTDGKRLDGMWMGGNGIAEWKNGKIVTNDLGSKSAQVVQNYLTKIAPSNWMSRSASMIERVASAYLNR